MNYKDTRHPNNPVLRDTQRTQRTKRLYTVNLSESIEELYFDQFRNAFKSFSAFIREMIARGLDTFDLQNDHLSDQDCEVN